jgi:hypothetical protein
MIKIESFEELFKSSCEIYENVKVVYVDEASSPPENIFR